MRIELKPGMYRVLTSDNRYIKHDGRGGLVATDEKQEPVRLTEALQIASDWLDSGYIPTLELAKHIVRINDSEIKCHCGAVWRFGRFSLKEEDCPHCDPEGWNLAIGLTDCKPIRIE